MDIMTRESLENNGYEVLSFDPDWIVAFNNNSEHIEIYTRCLIDEKDEGNLVSLLHDELGIIYKATNYGN